MTCLRKGRAQQLTMFWSTWSQARGQDLATCSGLAHERDYSCCISPEQKWQKRQQSKICSRIHSWFGLNIIYPDQMDIMKQATTNILIRISISRNIWWEANQRPDIFCLAFSFHKQLLQRVDCCFLWAMTRNIVLSNRSARAFINFSFQCKLELADWNRVKRKTYWNRSKSRSASESLLWAVLVIIDLYQR